MPIGTVRPRIWFPIVLLLLATTSPPAARSTLSVCGSGCTFNNLQSALNAASSGDTIVLAAGEPYVGNWELPAARHATPVKITSSASCPDRRIGPQDLHLLPILQARSTDTPAISGWGASGWEFECMRFEPSAGGAHNVIQLVNVALGDGNFVNTDNVVFDRIYVSPSDANVRKAIHADGGNITLTRSYIANVRQPWSEAKAFTMQEGPGPVTLTDNYLEAASINILFGGGDTSSSAHVPNNILIENNHLAKRAEWGDGQYMVKDLIELKTATNVTVRSNLMESAWFGGGEGGMLIQPVNDTANSPWNRVADVLFEGNIVRGVSRGIDILGYEWKACCNSSQTARIRVVDNLFVTMSRFFYAAGEIDDVTIDHNTIDNNVWASPWEPAGYIDAGDVSTTTEHRAGLYGIDHFVFTNNLMKRGPYGWLTRDHTEGQVTSMLEKATQSYHWTNNVIAGAARDTYPNCGGAFDCFPSVAVHNAQFNADYTLISGSRYRGAATDGSDLGWRPAGQSGGSSGGGGNDGGQGGGGGGTGPFNGAAAALPGVLQAENFDHGGQWVSYLRQRQRQRRRCVSNRRGRGHRFNGRYRRRLCGGLGECRRVDELYGERRDVRHLRRQGPRRPPGTRWHVPHRSQRCRCHWIAHGSFDRRMGRLDDGYCQRCVVERGSSNLAACVGFERRHGCHRQLQLDCRGCSLCGCFPIWRKQPDVTWSRASRGLRFRRRGCRLPR